MLELVRGVLLVLTAQVSREVGRADLRILFRHLRPLDGHPLLGCEFPAGHLASPLLGFGDAARTRHAASS